MENSKVEEELLQKRREYYRQYYTKNKSKVLAYKHAEYLRHKDRYKKYNRSKYIEDIEKIREESRIYSHKYYAKNKSEVIKKQRLYKSKNWKKYLLKTCQQRSKKANLECSITEEDINIPEFCPILGTKITFELGKGMVKTNPSIDRIDNSKGYVPGNIQILSRLANYMKFNATKEELILFAKGILNMYGENHD